MWQNNFLLAWIDWSCAFDFRICFGKTLTASNFDKKLTQSVAQVTIQYHVSKDFLHLHFAVDQVLSISRYDLKNLRMSCTQNYCIKNITVKILMLIFFWFCLLCWLINHYFASCLCCSWKLFCVGPCRWF